MKKSLNIGDVDLVHGVIPITKAAASLSDLIKRARESRQPIVVTQNGYASAVIIDITLYESLRDLAQKYLESIAIEENIESRVGGNTSADTAEQ